MSKFQNSVFISDINIKNVVHKLSRKYLYKFMDEQYVHNSSYHRLLLKNSA